jgi:tetratricopeptide (TPR) repeat protein
MLGVVHRSLKETEKEWDILSKFAVLDATTTDTYTRLMELASEKKDWPTVITNANRFLAVNPLVALPYQYLGRAAEATSRDKDAIDSYRTLLRLDPPDPVDVNFRLAKLLQRAGDSAARRHILQALEDAPRYREALRLLTDLSRQAVTNKSPAPERVLQ